MDALACGKPKSERTYRWLRLPSPPAVPPPRPVHMPSGCVQDGRLAAGDQLLSVDGRSLVGLSQERYRLFICLKLQKSTF